MEETWTCPQCETLNKNTDMCIVCGMSYQNAMDTMKKYNAKQSHNREDVNPAKIRFNWTDESKNVSEIQPKEEHKNLLHIVSLFTAIIGILTLLFVPYLAGVCSLAAIICGIISLKKQFNKISVAGIVLGGICFVILGVVL